MKTKKARKGGNIYSKIYRRPRLLLCYRQPLVKRLVEPLTERSNHLRQDGGLCFEIPPWQLQPVEVEQHLNRLKDTLGNSSERRQSEKSRVSLVNREVNRYVDTVIAPFLDTYHRNIQNSYQQVTNKILNRIKNEMNAALNRKQKIYTELTQLADSLKVPALCDEERRSIKKIANRHVSHIYKCTEQARTSIVKMGKYAEELMGITRRHMENAMVQVAQKMFDHNPYMIQKTNVTTCLRELSKAAVFLGYELDLSLSNARRHNEQSCEKLANCSYKAKKNTDEAVNILREYLYQCVYA